MSCLAGVASDVRIGCSWERGGNSTYHFISAASCVVSGSSADGLSTPPLHPLPGKELNARRSSNASSSSRGKKFKALREREAAQRTQGGASAAEAPERSKSGVATISAERGEAERLKVPDAPPAKNNNRD